MPPPPDTRPDEAPSGQQPAGSALGSGTGREALAANAGSAASAASAVPDPEATEATAPRTSSRPPRASGESLMSALQRYEPPPSASDTGDSDSWGGVDLPIPPGPQTDDNGGDTETITRQWDPERQRTAARAAAAAHRARAARDPRPPADPTSTAPEVPPASSMRLPTMDLTLEPALLDAGFNERYDMRELLGRGGMGEVRLCKDRHIGREVAIKVIRTDHMTRPDVMRRFEREARVQGQLEHPAIVPVYDFGIAPDGSMYFTMKRLRGVTFHDVLWMLRNGDPQALATYTRRKLLSAFTRACLAVAFAHSRGVLHRDLKPSNIMLGDFGEVYVLDWGLAKIRKAPDLSLEGRIETPASSEHRTIVGEVVGTPGYMAPEQALGEVDRLDARTDVYALGAILFEILTLEPLHKEDSPEDVMLSTLYGPETRPSIRTPGRDVPIELDAIIVRATAVKQEERFANARELCAAVETFLDGDRDLEQKKQMAGVHAAAARAAAAEARGTGKQAQVARQRAMREVGAALALNPSEREAVSTLVALMLDVPTEMPPEARKEFIASKRSADRESRRAMLLAYLSWLAFAPPAMALGVRDWGLGVVAFGFMVLSALTAWASYRGLLHDRLRFTVYVVGAVAMGFSSLLMGWAVILPGMAATHVLGFLLYGQRERWRLAVALGALAIIIPFGLQVAGIVPSSYGFHDGNFVIFPRITNFPPAGTMAFLLLASVGLIVAPAIIASRVSASLARAEERLFMQSWMLKHLVPDQARNAASVPPGPPSTTS